MKKILIYGAIALSSVLAPLPAVASYDYIDYPCPPSDLGPTCGINGEGWLKVYTNLRHQSKYSYEIWQDQTEFRLRFWESSNPSGEGWTLSQVFPSQADVHNHFNAHYGNQ